MQNMTLDYTTYGEPHENIVFLVHGFKGFKDWGFFPYIAKNIHQKTGFQVVTFNFSHNGLNSGDLEITNLEKFENNTYSLEIQDLANMVSAAEQGYFGHKAKYIYLIGHSRGGGIVLLTTALLQNPKIKKIITLATINHTNRFDNDLWQKQGYLEVINGRNGQVLRLGKALYKDIEQYKDTKLNILHAVEQISIPILFIHGTQDESVPYQESVVLHELRTKKQKPSFLFSVENTGHTFGIKHPFTAPSSELIQIIDKTVHFILNPV
jgi:pimeloyl-ACP methyl ester carboxylesterase